VIISRQRYEIDHRTIKLIVGLIALTLAIATYGFAYLTQTQTTILSISASYHVGGWARNSFVGSLCVISALMLAYNGVSWQEKTLSKIAAIAALGIAFFPCKCPEFTKSPEYVPIVHYFSAAVMFLVLAYMCRLFRKRARAKLDLDEFDLPGLRKAAEKRALIYSICGWAIVVSVLVLLLDKILDDKISDLVPRITFIGEAVGLIAFGVAWLTASRIIWGIAAPAERFAPWSGRDTVDNGSLTE
jgi:hypothetical protein